MRCAAYILLHQFHRAGGLEIKPSRIEAYALAHQRHLWCRGVPPGQVDQTGRTRRGPSHGMDHGVVLLQQVIPRDHHEIALEATSQRAGNGEILRSKIGCRRVDQIPYLCHGLSGLFHQRPITTNRPDQMGWDTLQGASLVETEGIGTKCPHQGNQRRPAGWRSPVCKGIG